MPSFRVLASLALCLLALPRAHAQGAVPVVMLSDIHFDPFHDPGKFAELRQEPVEQWSATLGSAPSGTQAADLQALQTSCHSRALDTAWPLLKLTLAAAHQAEAHPIFVTLSGDLLTHEFPCRFTHLAPDATPQDLSTFAAKTVAFVMLQLRLAFPRIPVYGALGNNDSGCADYRETLGDNFLKSSAATLAAATGASALAVTPEGDYSVALPPPFQHGRLLVLQDIFEARQFASCAGAPDPAPERSQMDWLRGQLAQAQEHGEHVWVLSHIPPGIDVYNSFRHFLLQPAQLCSAEPRAFLADTGLADALLDHPEVVRLALFGHTHMDEIRLLRRSTTDASAGSSSAVPAKLVPSVSPYIGNHPAFLVASVDPRSLTLKDWRTFVSPGQEGSTGPWVEAYRFTSTYHLPDVSAASVAQLADGFTGDKTGQSAASTAFRQHFYPGDIGLYALGLSQIWPAYACAVREHRPSAVHTCLCRAVPAPAPSAQP